MAREWRALGRGDTRNITMIQIMVIRTVLVYHGPSCEEIRSHAIYHGTGQKEIE